MKKISCKECGDLHDLYYLLKADNTKALLYFCPALKEAGTVYTVFIPLLEGLPIPTYLSDSQEYKELKMAVPAYSNFTEYQNEIISRWRRAKLVPSQMTKEQIVIVRKYVKGNIRW